MPHFRLFLFLLIQTALHVLNLHALHVCNWGALCVLLACIFWASSTQKEQSLCESWGLGNATMLTNSNIKGLGKMMK